MENRNVLIVGCGDIGVRVARLCQSDHRIVSGLARTDAAHKRLHAFGIEPVFGNLDEPDTLQNLPSAGRLVFYFAPPPGGGPIDTRMRNFCAAARSEKLPFKVVYISTSGVYGDCGGAWVTEETKPNPQTSRAKRRFDAEQTLQSWGDAHDVPVVVLRVTGIYGPGRLPIARLQQGHPVLKEAEAPPTNRIHADDLATTCVAAGVRAGNRQIFNVSDGHPGTMTQYFNAVADLLKLPRPKQISMSEARQIMNPIMLSYLSEARRMDNQKMLGKLEVTLNYPDLESGLKNIVVQHDLPNMGYYGSVRH